MIQDKTILAVVPARGGSKGVKLKNIQPINGIPLVALTGNIIRKIPQIDRAIVSTDHEEIAEVARQAGLDCPFKRPTYLSGDRVSDWDVVQHALLQCEKLDNTQYDIIVMLQPTSPFRTISHILTAINKLIDGQYDSVWTVSETDSKGHPLKQLVINNNKLDYYDDKGKEIIARQDLTPVYHRNGVAYAMTRECIVEQKTIYGKKASALVIEEYMVNIDTEFDLKLAEYFTNTLDLL